VSLPLYVTGYFSLSLPYLRPELTTAWHATDPDFAPISRGTFRTEAEAIVWAMDHLCGRPYTVQIINGCGIPYSLEWLESQDWGGKSCAIASHKLP
jgi:hypothetical protein